MTSQDSQAPQRAVPSALLRSNRPAAMPAPTPAAETPAAPAVAPAARRETEPKQRTPRKAPARKPEPVGKEQFNVRIDAALAARVRRAQRLAAVYEDVDSLSALAEAALEREATRILDAYDQASS